MAGGIPSLTLGEDMVDRFEGGIVALAFPLSGRDLEIAKVGSKAPFTHAQLHNLAQDMPRGRLQSWPQRVSTWAEVRRVAVNLAVVPASVIGGKGSFPCLTCGTLDAST